MPDTIEIPTEIPSAPAKFVDPATGQLRVDALLKSYLELERKLSTMMAPPAPDMAEPDRQRLMRALGVPDTPEGYRVECPHGLFEPDPEVNAKLHAAGLTPAQVQAVYDLAAERMIPMLRDLAAEDRAERELERVIAKFGGEAKWREVSRQLLAWARRALPPDAVDGLAASYEGVMALHRMMSSDEPAALRAAGAADLGETDLHGLMRDPRYWRDRDPATVARVTEGFRRLYGGAG